MSIMILLTLALGLTAGSTAADGDKALEGKWTIVSIERDGKADDAMQGAVREHAGGKYTLTPKGGKTIEGRFTADAGKSPKTLDTMPGEGRYKGKTLLGIYEIDGDTLKICFAEPGKDRPKEFVSKPGSGVVLVIHKRSK